MYRIIACDLDETLLQTWDKKVSEKNRKAIAEAAKEGVRFVVCTGRGFMTVQGTLDEIGMRDAENQYVISFNGGAITENKGNRLMHFAGIEFEEAEEFYRRGLDYNVAIHVYTKDVVYGYNMGLCGEREFLAGRMPVEEVDWHNLDALKGQEIVKCLYMNTDFDYLKKIEEDLKPITGNMDVSFSSNRYIEFNRKGVNKGAGLRQLADLLGVDIRDTIAIGDNYNDLSMIKDAGLGVGVANVAEGMRDECDYVTEATCDESAVAEVIEKFVFGA